MPLMPFHIISIWIKGLLSIALLLLGPYLLYRWYQEAHAEGPRKAEVGAAAAGRVFAPDFGINGQTALFVGGAGGGTPGKPAAIRRAALLESRRFRSPATRREERGQCP